MSTTQKITEIENEIARTQKNKATNFHIGLLKAKLARLRQQLLDGVSKSSGGSGEGFDVTKVGDARVGFVGFPSVGKSTLLTKLTGQFSAAADYEFTTLTCVPGILRYQGAKIQMLDLPGIIEGAKDGKGRGKQVIAVVRTCNLVLIVLDATNPLTHKRLIEKELEGFGLRLNKQPANISISQKDKGGIIVTNSVPLTHLDHETIVSICHEYRVINCSINFKTDATADEFIDALEGNRIYVPCIYVLNKIDQITMEELDLLSQCQHTCLISAKDNWNLDTLVKMIWEYLNLIRIYTKPHGQAPDYSDPVVLKRNKATIADFCVRIHKQILDQLKYALVWGTSVKFNPQKVGKDHVLNDEDIVQLVKK
uniref:Developmentally-regulated GTP-binding protein 1 n=1 Tax=Dermatophagoides pteronyssinus TaxID=6956 RepID=A0A6P6XK12_DERPT|nr:developmentally-regulated G-protein 3-like [Dermatophagoides pteronyssinus]